MAAFPSHLPHTWLHRPWALGSSPRSLSAWTKAGCWGATAARPSSSSLRCPSSSFSAFFVVRLAASTSRTLTWPSSSKDSAQGSAPAPATWDYYDLWQPPPLLWMMVSKRYKKQNAHLHPQEFSHVQVSVCLHVCMHDVDSLEDLKPHMQSAATECSSFFSSRTYPLKYQAKQPLLGIVSIAKSLSHQFFVGSCQVGGLKDEVPRTPQVKCIVLLIKPLLNPRLVGRGVGNLSILGCWDGLNSTRPMFAGGNAMFVEKLPFLIVFAVIIETQWLEQLNGPQFHQNVLMLETGEWSFNMMKRCPRGNLSIYLSIHPSIYLSYLTLSYLILPCLILSYLVLSVYLYIYRSIDRSISMYIYLYLPIYRSIDLSTYLSIYLSVYLSILVSK